MDEPNSVNFELVREHADTIIMNILLEKDRYGYEIIDILNEKSHGKYSIKQPTLYNALKRLEKQGFITSYFGDETNGGRRKYYTLSDKGRKILLKDQAEWEFSRTILDNLLSDKQVDLKTVEAPFELNEIKPATKRIKIHEEKEEAEPTPAPVQTSFVIPITLEAKVGSNAPIEIKAVEQAKIEPEIIDIEAKALAEEMRILEQKKNEEKEKAAKILFSAFEPVQIYEEKPKIEIKNEYKEALASEAPSTMRSDIFGEKPYSYKDAFSSIFDKSAANDMIKGVEKKENALLNHKPKHFNDLKNELLAEDVKLRMYSKPSTSGFYHMRYIYSNKILRDASILLFLAIAVQLLVFFVAKSAFGMNNNAIFIIGGLSLLLPVLGFVNYCMFKEKRSRAKFNVKNSLINSLIIFVFIAAIFTCASLIITSIEITFATGRLFVAYILMANIPISVIIYDILYKSKNYHIKD